MERFKYAAVGIHPRQLPHVSFCHMCVTSMGRIWRSKYWEVLLTSIPSQLLIKCSDNGLDELRRLLKLNGTNISGIYYESNEPLSKNEGDLIRWVNDKINEGSVQIDIPANLTEGVSQDRLADCRALCKINRVNIRMLK